MRVFVFIWFLVASVALSAVEKAPFLVDAWTTDNGLPQNTILGIGQTSDGYLWVATFNGLARFDGVRFTVFDPLNTPELRSARIIDLQPDGRGGLWIFSEEGYLTRLSNGHFEAYNGRHGLTNSRFACTSADPDGNVWITNKDDVGEIYRSTPTGFVRAKILTELTAQSIPLVANAHRAFWMPDGKSWQRVDERAFRASAAAGEMARAFSWSPSNDGDLWGIFPDKIQKLRSGYTQKFPDGFRINGDLTHLIEDREGNLIIATWVQGVSIVQPNGKANFIPLVGGPIARSVRILFVDREGNRWVGTDTAGLQRIKSRVFKTYLPEDGLSGEVIRSIDAHPDGGLWVVTSQGVDRARAEGEFFNFMTDKHDWWTWSHARNGDAWMGGFGGSVARMNAADFVEVPTPVSSVRVIAPHHSEGVWIGGYGGFGHTRGDQFVPVELPKEIREPFVRAIVHAGPDELWVGLYEGGVYLLDSKGWHRFGRPEGLKDDQIISLHRDDDGVIWVGTSFGGLNRLKDGRFSNFQDAISSMPSRVSAIVEDDLGFLWLASINGIHRVSRRELNEVAEGKRASAFIRQFTRADGLESTECSEARQPTACKTTDGKLWFATINGLSVIDPRNLPANPLPPPVVIEEVLVDGKIISDPREGSTSQRSLVLRPGASHVEIHYTAVTLQSAEKARFKYRLSGLDRDWVDAGSRRIADFNKLPPDHYVFRVTAANNSGLWNDQGQTLEMTVQPFVYQTWWFRGALLLLLAGLIATAVKMRIATANRERDLHEEFARRLIESQERERSRIARELHDGLGQDLLVIKNYAVLGLNSNPESAAAGHYNTISETAAEAIRQVREISHDLRPYQLEHLGATAAIRSIFKRLAEGPIRFEASIENIDALFSKEDASHVFRILQELTNNVLKHSGATQCTAIVERRGDHVHIVVNDNGKGFDAGPRGSGLGVRGIAERVHILGGKVNMKSLENGGAHVEIRIPVRGARLSP